MFRMCRACAHTGDREERPGLCPGPAGAVTPWRAAHDGPRPILIVPRPASAASKLAETGVLLAWDRRLPPRSGTDSGGAPSELRNPSLWSWTGWAPQRHKKRPAFRPAFQHPKRDDQNVKMWPVSSLAPVTPVKVTVVLSESVITKLPSVSTPAASAEATSLGL